MIILVFLQLCSQFIFFFKESIQLIICITDLAQEARGGNTFFKLVTSFHRTKRISFFIMMETNKFCSRVKTCRGPAGERESSCEDSRELLGDSKLWFGFFSWTHKWKALTNTVTQIHYFFCRRFNTHLIIKFSLLQIIIKRGIAEWENYCPSFWKEKEHAISGRLRTVTLWLIARTYFFIC